MTKPSDDTKETKPKTPEQLERDQQRELEQQRGGREQQRRPRPRMRIGAPVIFCTREGDELVENAATIVKIHDSPELGSAGVDLHVLYQNGEPGREKRVHESEGLELGRWRWQRE